MNARVLLKQYPQSPRTRLPFFAKTAPKNHGPRTFREPTRIGVKEAFDNVEVLNANNLS
jgi:hypothetical protein